jgi:hypothetical protein
VNTLDSLDRNLMSEEKERGVSKTGSVYNVGMDRSKACKKVM